MKTEHEKVTWESETVESKNKILIPKETADQNVI